MSDNSRNQYHLLGVPQEMEPKRQNLAALASNGYGSSSRTDPMLLHPLHTPTTDTANHMVNSKSFSHPQQFAGQGYLHMGHWNEPYFSNTSFMQQLASSPTSSLLKTDLRSSPMYHPYSVPPAMDRRSGLLLKNDSPLGVLPSTHYSNQLEEQVQASYKLQQMYGSSNVVGNSNAHGKFENLVRSSPIGNEYLKQSRSPYKGYEKMSKSPVTNGASLPVDKPLTNFSNKHEKEIRQNSLRNTCTTSSVYLPFSHNKMISKPVTTSLPNVNYENSSNVSKEDRLYQKQTIVTVSSASPYKQPPYYSNGKYKPSTPVPSDTKSPSKRALELNGNFKDAYSKNVSSYLPYGYNAADPYLSPYSKTYSQKPPYPIPSYDPLSYLSSKDRMYSSIKDQYPPYPKSSLSSTSNTHYPVISSAPIPKTVPASLYPYNPHTSQLVNPAPIKETKTKLPGQLSSQLSEQRSSSGYTNYSVERNKVNQHHMNLAQNLYQHSSSLKPISADVNSRLLNKIDQSKSISVPPKLQPTNDSLKQKKIVPEYISKHENKTKPDDKPKNNLSIPNKPTFDINSGISNKPSDSSYNLNLQPSQNSRSSVIQINTMNNKTEIFRNNITVMESSNTTVCTSVTTSMGQISSAEKNLTSVVKVTSTTSSISSSLSVPNSVEKKFHNLLEDMCQEEIAIAAAKQNNQSSNPIVSSATVKANPNNNATKPINNKGTPNKRKPSLRDIEENDFLYDWVSSSEAEAENDNSSDEDYHCPTGVVTKRSRLGLTKKRPMRKSSVRAAVEIQSMARDISQIEAEKAVATYMSDTSFLPVKETEKVKVPNKLINEEKPQKRRPGRPRKVLLDENSKSVPVKKIKEPKPVKIVMEDGKEVRVKRKYVRKKPLQRAKTKDKIKRRRSKFDKEDELENKKRKVTSKEKESSTDAPDSLPNSSNKDNGVAIISLVPEQEGSSTHRSASVTKPENLSGSNNTEIPSYIPTMDLKQKVGRTNEDQSGNNAYTKTEEECIIDRVERAIKRGKQKYHSTSNSESLKTLKFPKLSLDKKKTTFGSGIAKKFEKTQKSKQPGKALSRNSSKVRKGDGLRRFGMRKKRQGKFAPRSNKTKKNDIKSIVKEKLAGIKQLAPQTNETGKSEPLPVTNEQPVKRNLMFNLPPSPEEFSSSDEAISPDNDSSILDPKFDFAKLNIKKLTCNSAVGETVLHKAAKFGYIEHLMYYLDQGHYDVNVTDNAGYTPLHEASVHNQREAAIFLLSRGADVSKCSVDGTLPMHDSVVNDHLEMTRILLACGADPLVSKFSGQNIWKMIYSEGMRNFINGYIKEIKPSTEVPGYIEKNWRLPCSSLFDPKESHLYNCLDHPPNPQTGEIQFELFENEPIQTFLLQLTSDSEREQYVLVDDVVAATGNPDIEFEENLKSQFVSYKKFKQQINESQVLKNTVKCDEIFSKCKIGNMQCPLKIVRYDKSIQKLLNMETFKVNLMTSEIKHNRSKDSLKSEKLSSPNCCTTEKKEDIKKNENSKETPAKVNCHCKENLPNLKTNAWTKQDDSKSIKDNLFDTEHSSDKLDKNINSTDIISNNSKVNIDL